MRKLMPLLAAVVVALAFAADVTAQVPAQTTAPAGVAVPTGPSTYAPLGMGFTVVGVGIGLGLIGFGAMGGIARQPEQADNIRTAMLIIGGLVEGAGIIGLVLCLVAR